MGCFSIGFIGCLFGIASVGASSVELPSVDQFVEHSTDMAVGRVVDIVDADQSPQRFVKIEIDRWLKRSDTQQAEPTVAWIRVQRSVAGAVEFDRGERVVLDLATEEGLREDLPIFRVQNLGLGKLIIDAKNDKLSGMLLSNTTEDVFVSTFTEKIEQQRKGSGQVSGVVSPSPGKLESTANSFVSPQPEVIADAADSNPKSSRLYLGIAVLGVAIFFLVVFLRK